MLFKKKIPFPDVLNQLVSVITASPINLGAVKDLPEIKEIGVSKVIENLNYFQLIILFDLLHAKAKEINPSISESELLEMSANSLRIGFSEVGINGDKLENTTQKIMERFLTYKAKIEMASGTEDRYFLFCKIFADNQAPIDYEEIDKIDPLTPSKSQAQNFMIFDLAKQRKESIESIIVKSFRKYKPVFE